MALITTTGVNVTVDETSGLQNDFTSDVTGDLEDNDTLLTLPTLFSGRLAALLAATTPTETLIGTALSGHDGTNSGLNAFTLAPAAGASITDIRFTDSAGALLNGLDSGLDTAGGASVYLYTDTTNNNIVLGRAAANGSADPNGAIVFAAYIEETGSPVTGGKIWTTLYQPLRHGDPASPDDSVDLLNKVFIGTTQDTAFSLANAPSGQNLFLMFTTANPTVVNVGGIDRITDVAIIATGKNPADQSSGANITTGDTINTSQAGGPTTFGTNSQMITEQEGIRFTFVTGARQGFTIPNLDQNEADVEANIDFTNVFGARTANFDVVQLQSGKSAQVKITAFSTDAETGAGFIDGYADDSAVAITNVRVINIATGQVIENSNESVNDPSIGIAFAGGVATVTGVQAGQKIEYTTTADHNRVLIENGAALDAKGNDHADFDIGGFKLVQVSTETAEIGSRIVFEDDGPSITVSTAGPADALAVDESDLNANASADFADNFGNTSSYGADGAGTLSSAYALGVKSPGVDSGLDDVASGNSVFLYLEAGQVVGRVGTGAAAANPAGAISFTVSVSATGTVTLDQVLAMKHPDASNADDAVSPSAADLISLTRTDTITDRDGDSRTGAASLDIGQALSFEDDGPGVTVRTAGPADALAVDETDLNANASASFADNFGNTPSYGADGAGTLSSAYALGVASAGADSGLVDVASGEAVLLRVNGAGAVEGYTATGNALVFTVSVDATGLVSLDQIRALRHSDGGNPDDAVTLAAPDLIQLSRTDTITDRDGDSRTGSVALDIGQALSFEDDGPSITVSVAAAADALTVDETDLNANASADFSDNFGNTPSYGADGAGTLSSAYALSVKSPGVDSGLDDVASGNSVFLYLEAGQVVGRVGTGAAAANPAGAISFTVSVSATGTVTLDQLLAMRHPDGANPDDAVSPSAADLISLRRTDTITDRDGDSRTGAASLDIGQALSFKDDGPSISTTGTEPTLTVDETLLGADTLASFAGNFTSAFGADGAGTLTYALGVVAGASGLTDTATGEAVNLSLVDGVVQGRTATSNLLVFSASVAANGDVTLDQQRAVVHSDPANPDDSKSLASDNLVTLTGTQTDKDGDSAQATLNIGSNLVFKDDGPAIETPPVQDTSPTLGATQWTYAGAFAYSIGADHHGPTYSATDSDFAELSLSGLANDAAIGSSSVTWDSESDSLATFDLSFNYDHDRNGTATQPVTGQLVFDKGNGTYTVTLDALQVSQDVTLGQGTGYETYDINGTTPSSGPSPVATGKLGEGFYLQITGFESPLRAGAVGDTVVVPGDLVTGTQASVTLSSTALGVSGNTIQAGEAANINFFDTDPKGNLGATNFSYATDFFIKFDGYETESDDLLLIVSLADANDSSVTTTRAIYVDQGDVYENDTINTGLAGTKYEDLILNDPADPVDPFLDNNDALLIVESSDYNINVGDNWVIKGIQILSNDAGLTGSAIDLNRAVGSSGGSSIGDTIAEDTSTNPLKIIDAGFSTTTTTPPTLDLALDFKVVDADGDPTAEQTIDIEYGLPAQQVALMGISSFEPVGLA